MDGRKQATAARVPSDAIRIDGRLDESVWTLATPVGDFVQKEPIEGAPPTEQTEIRFVYDDNALYVGAQGGGRGRGRGPVVSSRDNDAGLAEYILIFGSLTASGDNFFAVKVSYWLGV